MNNIISTDLLSWRKESKSFCVEMSTLSANGVEPEFVKRYDYGKFVYIWKFIIENPKTGNRMNFEMNPNLKTNVENLYTVDPSGQGQYFDTENDLLFQVFTGQNGIALVIFND